MLKDQMSGHEFEQARRRAGLTKVEIGRRLGRTDDTITTYSGVNGVPARDTPMVRLALAAIINNVPPFRGEK